MRITLLLLLACFVGAQQSAAQHRAAYYAPTVSEAIASGEPVVLGEWVSAEEHPRRRPDDYKPGRTVFKVVEIIEDSKKSFEDAGEIILEEYRPGPPGDLALLLGSPLQDVEWREPIPATKASLQYVKAVPKQGVSWEKRLEFFVVYLEHPDDLIAKDAFLEFARAPFEEIQKLSDKLPREKLRQWVLSKDTNKFRLDLYGEMLGVCGNEQDAKFIEALEALIKNPGKDFGLGLDGIMGGYLLLKGEEGLELLEETKLKAGVKAPIGETYAAMKAILFVSEYGDIDKDRLKKSMRLLLGHPVLGAFAIEYLTYWKDWDVQDKVLALYDDTKAIKPDRLKRAIVEYLLACSEDSAENADGNPIQEHATTAKKHLGTLRRKDPATVKKIEQYLGIIN